ncbi:hypothetical protein MKW98_000222 [Papaver atlanticum]|uniref:Uncharacterized protein n=1 Tax=Papaver atlanticum TaxID=357466 RepID=A0AAD4XJF7_9MAGN|nr:hypothetical protein MKW98_000222 [Papaver atlanticum]
MITSELTAGVYLYASQNDTLPLVLMNGLESKCIATITVFLSHFVIKCGSSSYHLYMRICSCKRVLYQKSLCRNDAKISCNCSAVSLVLYFQ